MIDPNFQQIPSRGAMSKYIKSLFVPPPNEEEEWFTIEQDGKIIEGAASDLVKTDRGTIRFDELVESDSIHL